MSQLLAARRLARRAAVLAAASTLAACRSDKSIGPAEVCNSANTSESLTLAPLQGARAAFGQRGACVSLTGGGARYLLVPQYASGGGTQDPTHTGYFLGNQETSAAAAAAFQRVMSGGALVGGWGRGGSRLDAQQALDRRLRLLERDLPPLPRDAALRSVDGAPAAQFAARRQFVTLGNTSGTSFQSVTADLKYAGANILIYMDTAAPSGFSDAELGKFGALFDSTLFPIDTAAFGRPSDLDQNGRVIVLMTPRVNALVSSTDCATNGFITGYFFGFDLASQDATRSNRGEVFYTFTPDSAGRYSCAHTVDDVERIVPATFIHELQHMISFGAHYVQRDGPDEEVWLNEGLSLIAEELGSLYYEQKYPPGTCGPGIRTSCDQLFPDSSQGYIVNNLIYAFDWLADAPNISVTTFDDQGTLEERGAAFLFLRWLGDHKGAAVFRSLVQTSAVGIANVQQAAGEPFPALFADFGISTYTDSIPGVPRTAVPARYRFLSRNLRQIHARFAALHAPVTPFYPVMPTALPAAGGETGEMVQGTMSWYLLEAPGPAAAVPLHLVRQDRRALRSSLVPQVGIFRLPD